MRVQRDQQCLASTKRRSNYQWRLPRIAHFVRCALLTVACLWWIAGCARRIDPVEQAETVGASAGNIAGVDHLAIRVTDMQRSGEFYARLFGPEVKKSPKAIVANPGSAPSPHYGVRLGESYLALALASPTLIDPRSLRRCER
jgi:hypothetical protein